MRTYLLPESGNDYKANLHRHSNLSDGKVSVEELKQWYSEHGYSIIAYTDHDVFLPHPELADESYSQYIGYKGLNAMEIVNGACVMAGFDDHNGRVYDDMLRAGQRLYCIADLMEKTDA